MEEKIGGILKLTEGFKLNGIIHCPCLKAPIVLTFIQLQYDGTNYYDSEQRGSSGWANNTGAFHIRLERSSAVFKLRPSQHAANEKAEVVCTGSDFYLLLLLSCLLRANLFWNLSDPS